MPTYSDTRGVAGQTVNYFCPILKGAKPQIEEKTYTPENLPVEGWHQCLLPEIKKDVAELLEEDNGAYFDVGVFGYPLKAGHFGVGQVR